MTTVCNSTYLFSILGSPPVPARFDGGTITSEGGALLTKATPDWAGNQPIR